VAIYKIIKGDVTEQETEAIVNAANTNLILGAGVAGAIRLKGGPQIQKECNEKASIIEGEVAVTSGGNLKAKYILHAATMPPGGRSSAQIVQKAVYSIFEKLREYKIKSASMPAIGCGIAGVNIKDGARVIIKAVIQEIEKDQYPEEFRIVLFTEEDYNIFLEAEKEM